MTAVSNIATPLGPSESFMLRDLARSALTPEDFPVRPQPLIPIDGAERYRIYFARDGYWQDRYNRTDRKYLGPTGVPTELFWPQPIGDFANAAQTASVEGAKKALLFHLTTGVPAVGLHSCHGWTEHTQESEEGLDDVDKAPTQLRSRLRAALASTKFHIVLLDGDWQSNRNVGSALATYAMELGDLGVRVRAVDLRGFGGYDDWFVKRYGPDRASWPGKETVLRELLRLPQVDIAALATSQRFMLGTLDRFNRGHTDFTERGHATQWLRLIGPGNVLYLTDCGRWAFWRNGRWVLSTGQPIEEVNELARYYLRKPLELEDVAASLTGKDDKQRALLAEAEALAKQGHRMSSVAARKNVLADVASRARQQASLSDFDADPNVLAVAGGAVVDLRTGDIRREVQGDKILQRCSASYNGTEPTGPGADRMRRFIDEITASAHGRPDREMATWLQRRIGASLRGRCQLGALELWIGEGANGKSVLADVLSRALGDYAATLPVGVLLSQCDKRSAEAASPFLMKAVNKRFVVVSETKDTDHLDLPKVKVLTGINDKVALRGNYQAGGEYPVTWTVVMLTNSLPNIPQSDEAIWDRLAPTPFRCRWRRQGIDDTALPPADLDLSHQWVSDADAQAWILWWAIQGSILYEEHGLPLKPAAVSQLSADYRNEQDLLGRWIQKRYRLEEGTRCESTAVYHDFLRFTEEEGHRAEWKKNLFTRRLRQRFPSVTTVESNGRMLYEGLAKISGGKF